MSGILATKNPSTPGGVWWETARKMLVQDEGIRRFPYKDTTGNWTIGIGRNLEATPLSNAVIYEMLDEDIERAVGAACSIFGSDVFDGWSAARQHAVINMLFNLGEGGFLKFERTIECMKNGDWKAAASHALDSLWAKQVGTRAHRIAALLADEHYHYQLSDRT